MEDYILLDEDFKNFAIGEFPYDKNHSAMGEYHFIHYPGYYGKSYQSWTTGTSAWCMMGVYEGILGIKRDYDGLRIDPCLPKEWEKAEVTRHFRGADYHVIIENPDHLEKGVLEIKTDGAVCDMSDKADGFVLPDFKDGKMHEVHVILRK